jgi:hypothetical protein
MDGRTYWHSPCGMQRPAEPAAASTGIPRPAAPLDVFDQWIETR